MKQIIENLELEYNPDNDSLCHPDGVEVTWSDNQLLTLVKDLYDEIARLRADHDLLVGQVQDLNNDNERRYDIITEQIEGV